MNHTTGPTTDSDIERSEGLTVAVCLCVVLASGFVAAVFARWDKAHVPTLEKTVNPNTASASSLARLPGIGWSRAQAIVAHRKQFGVAHEAETAFQSPQDLLEVPRIGPKTVEAISPWLSFDVTPAEPNASI
jgi:competence ComEA-like helix-hairpin-helix protein